MKILITTGVYPPKIGGPAQYAKNLASAFEKMGHNVVVKSFDTEDSLPTGIRHLYFFFKILPSVASAEIIFTLDTFSAGLPTVFASVLFGKKAVIRTGGDFLWEAYVERTRKKVLLKNFYETEMINFSRKESIIFKLTRWILSHASHIIFSTEWQRELFIKAYGLNSFKTSVVENYYGPKEQNISAKDKEFISSSRGIYVKNTDTLEEIFQSIKKEGKEAQLFLKQLPYQDFMDKIARSYAIINISLSEISPNIILDAIRYNRPFICTREVGIYERIKDAGYFIDPLNMEEIKRTVEYLLTEEGYKEAKEKVENFNFKHEFEDMAREFLEVYKKI